MTDLTITEFGDAWVNGAAGRTGVNYGSTNAVQVKSGERRGLVRPSLPNIAGRTVVEAVLVGHAYNALVAQAFTLALLTERFSPGRVTWANQPAANTAAGVTTTVGALATGAAIEWDVRDHLQAVADGTEWFGWRLSTSSTATNQRLRAMDSGAVAWELRITVSDAPDQPTDLRPQGGAISDSTPVLSWLFADAGFGSTTQAMSRVQVDTPAAGVDPDEVAPDYDSGWQSNISPEWDLAGRRTLVGAGPHFWRGAVQDADSNVSDWSDWAEFTVAAKPALVVDSPTGPFGDPTPTLTAHLSTGSVASWRAFVTSEDRSDIRARSGNRTGDISWTLPLRGRDGRRVLRDDKPGWIYLRVYPTGDWTTAVGQTTYVDTWIPAEWDEDLGVIAPTNLVVTQTSDDPCLRWQWMRTEAADAWVVQVDGETIARLDPEDVEASGGVYSWVDSGQVAPLRPHTLAVRAIDSGKRSTPARISGWSHIVEGVWVIPDDPAIGPLRFDGTGVGEWARTDYRATYTTSTGEEVDVTYGRPGRRGSFAGSIDANDGEGALWSTVAAVEALAESRIRTARLVWGSHSAAVRLRDVDVTPDDEIRPDTLLHIARFGFVETL